MSRQAPPLPAVLVCEDDQRASLHRPSVRLSDVIKQWALIGRDAAVLLLRVL